MRENTVVALFDTFDAAKGAVNDIVAAGARRDRISMLANDSSGDHPQLLTNPAYAREQFDEDSDAQPGVLTGAEIGIGVGGLLGFLASNISVPGIGYVVSNTWVALGVGAVIVGAIGAAIGAWADRSVSDKDAKLFEEGLKRGGTLVTVVVPEADVAKMEQAFKSAGAVDIEKRDHDWTAEGWVTFDPGAGLLGGAQAA